jgi:radical SAM superfamily enzyme YgiQ (UPF0313 family)
MRILLASINSKYIHTNLAIRSIKTYLKKTCPGHHYKILEWNLSHTLLEVIREIHVENPGWILFSVYVWNVEFTLKVIREIKKLLPALKIAVGGPEASYKAEEILTTCPAINHVIKGEGEEAAGKLLTAVCPAVLESQPVSDLDTLPFPYDDQDIENMRHQIFYYESSRGCPYGCIYCLSSIDRGVRYLSLERVQRDLDFFLKHKVNLVKFVDRTFNLDPARYLAIWRYILAHHNGVTTFHFELMADLLNDEALELLTTVPEKTFQVEIGIQSSNTETLQAVGRQTDLQKMRKNINRITANIHKHVDLIAGLPGETLEIFEKSFNFAITFKPEMLQLGFLKILAGTKMADYARENNYCYLSTPPYEVLSTPCLSFNDICLLKDIEKVLRIYYNSGKFKTTLDSLIATQDPFLFFRNFANYLRKQGAFQAPVKPAIYADYLQKYLAGTAAEHFL